MDGYFSIGKVAGTHGVKGTLRVFPTTDDPSRFSLLKEVILEQGGTHTTHRIMKTAYHKQFVLLTLEGISDMTEAEKRKGATLLIPESEALPLAEDEYYTRDLYGLKVYTDAEEYLGTLNEVYPTGANDVYAVRNLEAPESKELLIPAIKQCILQVDLRAGVMRVHLLEGLRD